MSTQGFICYVGEIYRVNVRLCTLDCIHTTYDLRSAETQLHSGHQSPLGDAQAHVAVISGPLLGQARPNKSNGGAARSSRARVAREGAVGAGGSQRLGRGVVRTGCWWGRVDEGEIGQGHQ